MSQRLAPSATRSADLAQARRHDRAQHAVDAGDCQQQRHARRTPMMTASANRRGDDGLLHELVERRCPVDRLLRDSTDQIAARAGSISAVASPALRTTNVIEPNGICASGMNSSSRAPRSRRVVPERADDADDLDLGR